MTRTSLLAIAAAATGCARAPARVEHGSPDAAMDSTARGRPARGKIEAERHRWFSFEVKRPCASIELDARARPADASLVIVAHGPDGKKQIRAGDGHLRLRFMHAPLGHYHFELSSPDPASYEVFVRNATTGFECGDALPTPPTETVPVRTAALPPAPAGFMLAPIMEWEGYQGRSGDPSSPEGWVARLASDDADSVGPVKSAQVVDAAGAVVPDVTVDVMAPVDNWGTTAVTHAHGPSVTTAVAVLVPLPAGATQPVHAAVIDRWRDGDAVLATLAAGALDGVAPGWRGVLAAPGHAELVRVEVVDVRPHNSRVRVDDGGTLASILDARDGTLSPAR